MAIVASSVLTDVRVLLNDTSGAIYADTPVYNLMNKAYRELQRKVSSYGISTTKEISSAIDVAANVVFLGDGAGLPANFLLPISMSERLQDSVEDFIPMDEFDFEPDIDREAELRYWSWREDEIKFVGATTAREVKLRYVRSLGTITGANSPILIIDADIWLAQRTAALAALVIGSNPTRAAAIMMDLDREGGIWDDFKLTLIRRQQSTPVRRRRTRYRVF